jgi:tagatose 6-phosphate kinase
MVAVTSDGAWLARLDEPLAGNATGAGDAAAAGVIRGLAAGHDWPELLRAAVAMSATSVLAPVAGHVDLAAYAELRSRVAISPVPVASGIS